MNSRIILLLSISFFTVACSNTPRINGSEMPPVDSITVYRHDLMMAEQSYQQQDYPLALRQYTSLFERSKQDTAVLFRLGNIYVHLKQHKNAVIAYEQVLSINSKMSKAWYNLAVIRMRVSLNTWQKMADTIAVTDPYYPAAQHYRQQLSALIEQGK